MPSGQTQTERRTEDVDKYAQNDGRLKAADKSYLAQFYIKPRHEVNQSMSTHIQGGHGHSGAPSPLDVGHAEYVDNPVVANLSPRYANALSNEYNLNFEPYARR